MGAKPTVSTGRGRKAVREVCNLAPGYGKTEAVLMDCVNELTGADVPVEQLREWIEWNLSEDYIRSKENKDTDEVEWVITDHGIAKESIK